MLFDKERMQIKAKLLNYLAYVDDNQKQNKIIQLLQKYEQKLPDGKLIDSLQKMKRKRMNYYSLCEDLVNDLLDKGITNNSRAVLNDLIDELTPLVANEPKNWWEQFVDWFKKATGSK